MGDPITCLLSFFLDSFLKRIVELIGTNFFLSSPFNSINYIVLQMYYSIGYTYFYFTFITETSVCVWALEINYHVFKYICIPPDIFTSGA